MAGRKTFTAGEVLQAADVNDFLMDQSVMVFAGTAARGSAIPSPSEGMVTYLEDADELQVFDGSEFTGVGGGKILQLVRATDSTQRSTASTSFADASISVTITPTKDTSAVIVIWSANAQPNTAPFVDLQITDASNVALSGAESMRLGSSTTSSMLTNALLIGYSTPATTSATTYKGRFKSSSANESLLNNNVNTGQLYAIEVGA